MRSQVRRVRAHVVTVSGVIHHHVAKRPHAFMMTKSTRYAQWHNWKYHRHVHIVTVVAYVFWMVVALAGFTRLAFAADLNDVFNFSNQASYTIDSGLEYSGSSVRMKTQGYTNDANTAALFHLDESSGTSVSDSSTNSNTGTTQNSPTWGAGNLNNGLTLNGTSQSFSVPDSSSISLGAQQTFESWIKPSVTFDNNATSRQTIFDKGSSQLYLDNTSGKLAYEVQNNSATSWSRTADTRGLNGSWNHEVAYIESQVVYGSDLYVGTSYLAGAGDVWKRSGGNWTKVGGDGLNSSWAGLTYEGVYSMAVLGSDLYAGLGSTAGDAEVWKCSLSSNCSSWTKVGGDGNGMNSTHEKIMTMYVQGGTLYAGTGLSAGDADVWRYNGGTSWTQIGGDGLNSSWAASTFEQVNEITGDGTNLYVGLGITAGDAEVWKYNGTTWLKIGGDAVNSSWADATYEYARSLTYFGGNLYVGLGLTAGDGEVWKYNGTTWSMIGGDGINSSWANSTFEYVYSLTNDGTNLYVGLGSSSSDADVWKWTGSAWSQIGGDSLNSGFVGQFVGSLIYDSGTSTLYAGLIDNTTNATVWGYTGSTWSIVGGSYVGNGWQAYTAGSVLSMTTHNSKQYIGLGATNGSAAVYEYDGSTYTLVGGNGYRGSWSYGATGTYNGVYSMVSYKGSLYVGLGQDAGEGEIWKYDGSNWTQVGGDGLNGSWSGASVAYSLTTWNDTLYAGITSPAGGSGLIYSYNGSTWTNIAGGSTNINGITNGQYSGTYSFAVYNNKLCAGFGTSAGQADLYCWTGSGSWSKIGGDGLNSSWNSNDAAIYSMAVYDGRLVVGTSDDSNRDPMIWTYDGTTWTKIGGGNVNSSWSDVVYYRVFSMATYNGELYVSLGYGGNNGHVWKWDGSTWTQVGGDGLNGSWSTTIESVRGLNVYKGKLYAGLGDSTSVDDQIYSLGNNAYVESATSSFDTSWKHIAATYDGTTAKLYINGTQDASVSSPVATTDNAKSLLIGQAYGSTQGAGDGDAYFNGTLDEIRLSNSARTSFTTKPYATNEQAVTLNNSVRLSGIASWESLANTSTLNGGSITYRLSDDGGTTWKYYSGGNWTTSASYTDASSITDISANIATFPVTFYGIKWQAILKSDGTQRVQLDDVTLASNSDSIVPATNASALKMYKTNGGNELQSNDWTNGASPYFSWTAGTDVDAGILGYCLYLGQTASADPTTTKGLLGTSPVYTGSACQFAVSGSSLDLSTAGLLATALTSSNDPYYLNVRAIDRAGNIYGSSAQFQFRFDNTAPSNPGYISAPSGFINSKIATLTWPTAGGQSASDLNSGVAGLQYRVNNGTWYGDSHSGSGDSADLLNNDGSYTTTSPNAPDESSITDGINTFYIRTWDAAGNVTTSYTTAALKVNTNGSPSEPQNVVATPGINTENNFGFSWAAPATFVGIESNLTYCYTVNVVPSSSNCTYTTAGTTSVPSGPFATQPSTNTFYVVARDESNNINYSNYSSVLFTANTPAPGIPLNIDVADVSVKATSNWRLAVTWDAPTSLGAGVSAYRVERSTSPGSGYAQVGSSSSTSFVDTGLSQQTYYYKVRACDSANNCGSYSSVVSLLPTGKFTSPAAQTSDAVVSNITTKRATISWNTDRASDSKISLGTESGTYSASEIGNSDQVSAHSIELDNLAAGTTYYFKTKWTDEDGNTGISQEYTFKTAPAPVLMEVNTSTIGLSTATVTFTIKDGVKADILYGKSDAFGGIKAVNTSISQSTYSLDLAGLDDGVKYLYRITMYDSEGGQYQSSIFSFVTPARPKISDLRFQPIEGEPTSTQRVTWVTNVPTNSQVNYGKTNTNGVIVQLAELKTTHEVTLRGLEDDSEYFMIAQGRDGNGNLAVSDRQVFRTALDTRPPVISDIVIEPTTRGTGTEARGQVVVSWKTDEPATSQVAYSEGSSAREFNNKTAEDAQLTTEHLVIVSDLPPSKVYSIMPVSKDRSSNSSTTEPQAAIIGRASENILTIVLNTLRNIFGF